MHENPVSRQTDFDVVRKLNDENTIGVVNADLGPEYSSTLVQLEHLEKLVEHAREELDVSHVFLHAAEDSPILISLWSDAQGAVGLSPIVSEEEAERLRGEKDAE